MVKRKRAKKEVKYFISYVCGKDSKVFYSNQIIGLEKKIDSGEMINTIQDKIKEQGNFEVVIITNFICLGK